MQGTKTNIYSDVKIPVLAGMQFGTKNIKIRKIGYDIFRRKYFLKSKKRSFTDRNGSRFGFDSRQRSNGNFARYKN
jgi:hypothetical protein